MVDDMSKRFYSHRTYILYIVAAAVATVVLSACSAPEYRRELVEADSLTSVNPNDATAMLDSISSAMAAAPEHERMYYELLRIKAADKAYATHTSDSAILKLVEYYENGGDSRLLPEAYYYAGSVYRDLKDAPRAIEFFQKAEETLKDSKNYRLMSNISAQEGFIFGQQYLYEEALQAHLKAYKYDSILKDTVNMVYSLRDIADIHRYNKSLDSCLIYFKKAMSFATKINNHEIINDINSSITNLYIKKQDYDTALKLLKANLYNNENKSKSHDYNMAVNIYMQTNQYDSAYKYSMKLLDIGTMHAKQTASESLAKIYLNKGDYINVEKYMQLTKTHIDSIFKITAAESVARMSSLYNYKLREKENLELKAENASQLNIILFSYIIICTISGILAIYIIRNVKKRKEQTEKFKRMKTELFKQSEAYINENKAKIAELEKQLFSTANENKSLTEKIEQQKADLILANENAKRKQARNEAARARLANTEIYKTIIQRAKADKVLHVDEWKALDETINAEIENFRSTIYEYHDISMQEYRICMLIRLDIPVKDIGTLLSLSTSGISKARKRLQEKLFGNDGTAKDFDAFIKSL